MNGITVFTNEVLNADLRTITKNGDPWFVAKDVAEALGYSDTTQAVRKHTKGGVEITLPSKGGNQTTKIIPEQDLYRLILKSHKPEAEPFQDWVTEEVLPSIRKTGNYSVESGDPVLILARKVLEQEDELNTYKAKDRVFGNRTPLGELSDITGCPKQFPVRGHLRSDRRVKKVTVTEEYDLFYQLPEEVTGGEVAE